MLERGRLELCSDLDPCLCLSADLLDMKSKIEGVKDGVAQIQCDGNSTPQIGLAHGLALADLESRQGMLFSGFAHAADPLQKKRDGFPWVIFSVPIWYPFGTSWAHFGTI